MGVGHQGEAAAAERPPPSARQRLCTPRGRHRRRSMPDPSHGTCSRTPSWPWPALSMPWPTGRGERHHPAMSGHGHARNDSQRNSCARTAKRTHRRWARKHARCCWHRPTPFPASRRTAAARTHSVAKLDEDLVGIELRGAPRLGDMRSGEAHATFFAGVDHPRERLQELGDGLLMVEHRAAPAVAELVGLNDAIADRSHELAEHVRRRPFAGGDAAHEDRHALESLRSQARVVAWRGKRDGGLVG